MCWVVPALLSPVYLEQEAPGSPSRLGILLLLGKMVTS